MIEQGDLEQNVVDPSVFDERPQDDGVFRISGMEGILFGFRSNHLVLTKGERAYGEVRRAIVTHALPAGVPLDETTLLERFDIGRTPLREALKRLSYEGFLVWPPHQAPTIRDIGLFELPILYDTRRLLEYRIAECAARYASPEDIQRMETIRQMLETASRLGYVYEAVELDFALHSTIANSTQNRFLADASNTLNLLSLRIWYQAHRILGISNVDKIHSQLVDAISNHDIGTSRQLMEVHINRSIERQRELQRLGVTAPALSP